MTGGGTGGHLYPALAVAEALKKRQRDAGIFFVGSNRGIEAKEVPEAGLPFRGLSTTGFPRRPGFRSLVAAWSFGRAVFAAREILRELKPNVVFSTGGYASAPVVAAARWEKIPVVIHEQNSVPGLTNRVASRFAAEVFLAFAMARVFFPRRGHLRLSGNPLREQVTTGDAVRAVRLFHLEENRQTVLVFGGSQGARSINDAFCDALPHFTGRTDVQFLVQTGQDDYDRVMGRCRDVEVKLWARRFIADMGDAYALADLVVCRAGAMTISELAACGLPAVLIPYPHAARNHQAHNAEMLAEAGAAVIIADAHLDGDELARTVDELLSDKRRLREMSVNALRAARPEAADKVADALLKYRPASELPVEAPGPPPRGNWRDERAGRGGPRSGPSAGTARPGRQGQDPRAAGTRPSGGGPGGGDVRGGGGRNDSGRRDSGRNGPGRSGTGRSGAGRSDTARRGGRPSGGASQGGARVEGARGAPRNGATTRPEGGAA
jgi:UDP-N-acetylglucosamine--N-acetylmuramyl-(pentapeptide) pyrophosphoryl-undecaprenol N-acetylglucosamine transferase